MISRLKCAGSSSGANITINTTAPLQGGDTNTTFTLSWGFVGEALGDLAYRGVSGWVRRAIGAPGDVLTVVAGIPTWAAPTGGTPYFAGTGLTLTGGDTFNVDYGIVAGTALEGSQDGNYVHIAGPETITGIKTFGAAPVLDVGIPLQVDTGGGIINVYQYSSGHEFGDGTAPMMIVGTTSSEMRTGTVVRYVQSTSTHSWYVPTGLKMTLASGLHVGTTVVSRSNGEVGAATGFAQGTTARAASASIDLQGTTTGVLVNRLTTVQRDAIAAPATSLLIYNTTTARFEYYTGSAWKPITDGGMSLYVAGAAGMGPGGTNPQYATLTAMQAAMVADGANSGAPRVGFFVGEFVEDVTLLDGCFLVGVNPSASAQSIIGSVTTLTTSTTAGLSNCGVYPPGATVGGFNNQSIDGFSLRFTNCNFYGGNVAGSHGFAVDGSLLQNDSFIYAVNCTTTGGVSGDGLNATGPVEILWSGLVRAGGNIAGSTGRAMRLDDSVDVVVTVPAEVNAESGPPDHIIGSMTLTNTSNLSLGVGVNVFGYSDFLVGPVFIETSLFEIENGSTVALQGGHKFRMDANSNFLFSTGTSGSVYTHGAYALDADATTRYQTAAGITYDGYYLTHPERVQTITGTATIADATTLALVVPSSPTTFTVTMPNPASWREERRLRVKYTGGTYTQNLTLAAHASAGIDYDATLNSTVFKWNDAYEFAAHDDKWIILASKTTAAAPASYTLPVYLVGPAASGPAGSSPQYATPAAAYAQMVTDGISISNPKAMLVAPGAYTWDNILLKQGLTVMGYAGRAEETIITTVTGLAMDAADATLACVWQDLTIDNQSVTNTRGLTIATSNTIRNAQLRRVKFTGNATAGDCLRISGTGAAGVTLEQCVLVPTQATYVGLSAGSGIVFARDCVLGSATTTKNRDVVLVENAGILVIEGGYSYGKQTVNGAGSTIEHSMGHQQTVNGVAFVNAANLGVFLRKPGCRYTVETASPTYGFDSTTGGGIMLFGPAILDGLTNGHRTNLGLIAYGGYGVSDDDVIQIVTGAATLSRQTTLAVVLPLSGASFTVTLASVVSETTGRKVTVVHAGPSFKQTITIAPFAGERIRGSLTGLTLQADNAFVFKAFDFGGVQDNLVVGGFGFSVTAGAPTYAPLLHGLKVTTLADTSEAVIGGGAWNASDHVGTTVKLRVTGASTDGANAVEVRLYKLVAGVWTAFTNLNGVNNFLTITDANGEHKTSDDIAGQLTDGDVLQLRVTPTNAATQAVMYRGTLAVTA